MSTGFLELTHLASTWAMVGLIWIIQLVHYPMFVQVERAQFIAFHQRHTRGLGMIAGPLMCLELMTAAIVVMSHMQSGNLSYIFALSLVPLILVWISTFLIQVPLHNRLAGGFDADVHRKLMCSNRWRTAAWTMRGFFVLIALGSGGGDR